MTRKVKVLSPIDSSCEVEALIDAGADELYGGLLPSGRSSDAVPVNRRSFAGAQFPDSHDFAAAVAVAKGRGIPFHLALNAPFYAPARLEEILGLATEAITFGVSGFIVAAPGLIKRLKTEHPEAIITLSTLGGAMNAEANLHYAELGADRAVLPRHLSLDEMASIVEAVPGLSFEAFVLIGKCMNEEAFCTFQHISPEKRWPCEIPYEYYEGDSPEPSAGGMAAIAGRRALMQFDRRMGCGLCAVPRLVRMGVGTLKLVGRGGPTAGKVANIKLARKILAESDCGKLDARADYIARFGRPCGEPVCYFPEIYRNYGIGA